jgi:hypothetical protein
MSKIWRSQLFPQKGIFGGRAFEVMRCLVRRAGGFGGAGYQLISQSWCEDFRDYLEGAGQGEQPDNHDRRPSAYHGQD